MIIIFIFSILWTEYGDLNPINDPSVYVKGGEAFSWLNPSYLYRKKMITFTGGVYPEFIRYTEDDKEVVHFYTLSPSLSMSVPVGKFFFSLGNYEKINFDWDFVSDTLSFEDFQYRYIYKSRGSLNEVKISSGYEILNGLYGGVGISRIYGTLVEEWTTEVFPYGDARYDTLKYINSGYEFSTGITLFRKKFALSTFIVYSPAINIKEYVIFREDTLSNGDKDVSFNDGMKFSSSFILFPDKKYSFTGSLMYGTGNELYSISGGSLHFNMAYQKFGDSFGAGLITRDETNFLFFSYGIYLPLKEKGVFWFSTALKLSNNVQVLNCNLGIHLFEKWKLRKRGWY